MGKQVIFPLKPCSFCSPVKWDNANHMGGLMFMYAPSAIVSMPELCEIQSAEKALTSWLHVSGAVWAAQRENVD